MSRTFSTYGAISNALKHLQFDLQKEKKKGGGQGEYSKRLRPRAGERVVVHTLAHYSHPAETIGKNKKHLIKSRERGARV